MGGRGSLRESASVESQCKINAVLPPSPSPLLSPAPPWNWFVGRAWLRVAGKDVGGKTRVEEEVEEEIVVVGGCGRYLLFLQWMKESV